MRIDLRVIRGDLRRFGSARETGPPEARGRSNNRRQAVSTGSQPDVIPCWVQPYVARPGDTKGTHRGTLAIVGTARHRAVAARAHQPQLVLGGLAGLDRSRPSLAGAAAGHARRSNGSNYSFARSAVIKGIAWVPSRTRSSTARRCLSWRAGSTNS